MRVIALLAACILLLLFLGIVTEATPLYLLERVIAYRQDVALLWGQLADSVIAASSQVTDSASDQAGLGPMRAALVMADAATLEARASASSTAKAAISLPPPRLTGRAVADGLTCVNHKQLRQPCSNLELLGIDPDCATQQRHLLMPARMLRLLSESWCRSGN